MKTVSKLLIASAVVVSFAAPAMATAYNSDNFIQQELGVSANAPAQMAVRTKGFATNKGTWVDQSPYANRGADQINGGM